MDQEVRLYLWDMSHEAAPILDLTMAFKIKEFDQISGYSSAGHHVSTVIVHGEIQHTIASLQVTTRGHLEAKVAPWFDSERQRAVKSVSRKCLFVHCIPLYDQNS